MDNSTAADLAYQLRFLFIPFKIYSADIKCSFKFILSRIYHFAKSYNNNIYATSETLGRNYGVSASTIRVVIKAARDAGLMEKNKIKFIDIHTFETPNNPPGKEIYPPYLLIPEHAFLHEDLSAADKLTYGLLYYRVNSDDGSVRNPKKELAQSLGVTVDTLKGKIKKFERLKLVEKASEKNRHKLYLTHYPSYIQARLSYNNTVRGELSTDGVDLITQGGEDSNKRGEYGNIEGVKAVTHINNNINNKNNNSVFEMKKLSFEKESLKNDHDYVPNWNVGKGGRTSTEAFYGTKEFEERNQGRADFNEFSISRGRAVIDAYIEAKQKNGDDDIQLLQNSSESAESALAYMCQKLNIKREKVDKKDESG